ncbi:MAG: NAD(P)H-dependent oxidoreductase [Marinosulfonomonas sp.]|nr:NAD(P)H-dependent oxidoreductase [Marinosulfonomonas sp.]
MTNLLFFAGNSQKGSLNSRLVGASAELTKLNFPEITSITLLQLSDYDLPVFPNSDDGVPDVPEKANELQKLLAQTDGIFIGSDEYSGMYSTRFRNALRWLASIDGPLVFSDKPIALCGATPGGVGGLRGHPALGQLLRVMGGNVISQHIHLGTATSAFDDAGALLPRVEKQLLDGAIKKLVQAARASSAD